jgi:molybdenum cofactor cytidylyltransferase
MLLDHSIAIVILAAGRGERMGDTGVHPSKLLMPLRDGQSILAHAVRNADAFGPSEMVVVVRPDMITPIREVIQNPKSNIQNRILANPRFAEGMGTSLAAGIAALGDDTQAALVMLGDTPFVLPGIVDALVAAYLRQHAPITIPVYGEAVGPPTLFDRRAFPDLLNLQGDAGGRQLLSLYPGEACRVAFRAEDRPLDIDTPEDLRKVLSFEF